MRLLDAMEEDGGQVQEDQVEEEEKEEGSCSSSSKGEETTGEEEDANKVQKLCGHCRKPGHYKKRCPELMDIQNPKEKVPFTCGQDTQARQRQGRNYPKQPMNDEDDEDSSRKTADDNAGSNGGRQTRSEQGKEAHSKPQRKSCPKCKKTACRCQLSSSEIEGADGGCSSGTNRKTRSEQGKGDQRNEVILHAHIHTATNTSAHKCLGCILQRLLI